MSAALQLPFLWATVAVTRRWRTGRSIDPYSGSSADPDPAVPQNAEAPSISLAFYRKHTERTLRRYLYASMLVGRAPAILGDRSGADGCRAAKSKPLKTP